MLVGNGYSSKGVTRKLCPPMDNIPQPKNRVDTSAILARLRAEMRKITVVQGPPIDAYIVTFGDEHQSEYVAPRDQRLQYISGFSGDGMAVITLKKAALWVSDLYKLQANQELSCEWTLMIQSNSVSDWLKMELPGGRVGADPALVANSQWEGLLKELANSSTTLFPVKNNLVDQIWAHRPNYTSHEAYVWPIEYAGKTWQHKVSSVREVMKGDACDALVLTGLDEIGWLLNIRGRNIPHLPLLRAFLLITKDQIHLYTDLNKLAEQVKTHLRTESCFSALCARTHNYEQIWTDLRTLSQIWKKVCLPSETAFSPGVSRAIYLTIPAEKRKSMKSPIVAMKAEKNPVERQGMRNAHIRDAAAICDFMAYFELKMSLGEKWDELSISNSLDQFRREQALNRGISFRTTVAFGSHAALPHYEPNNATKLDVDNSSVLLIDSGGHYLDGTTDVTRTFHLGTPTEEQIDAYTRVLMGAINLAMLTFPHSLHMNKVDILARAPLWDAGFDYNHGTGHGIGSFLSVHEGPIFIAYNRNDDELFKEGYFFSDEPGYYKEDKFGIRLENILEVVERNGKNDSNTKFFGFDSVTLVPFEPRLIDLSKLSPQQIHWLNEYNKRVRNEVGTELKKQSRMKGFYWMMDKTLHIPEDCRLRGSSSSLKSQILIYVSIAFVISMAAF
ncbi:hypothetical protein AAG570_003818 [Ranatra chinensis]|uniref:Xaa-Pro aminopeptidase 1 n=1 Tax=Ranatra chinensis TaxID=642074 RepID=A0ABD0YT89_9HEMI